MATPPGRHIRAPSHGASHMRWKSSLESSIPPALPYPAFATNKSIGPRSTSTCSTSARVAASSATSRVAAVARAPISAATLSAFAVSRSAMTTNRAPSCTKRLASASLMPLPPPVTIATLSSSSIRVRLRTWARRRQLAAETAPRRCAPCQPWQWPREVSRPRVATTHRLPVGAARAVALRTRAAPNVRSTGRRSG